MSIKVVSHDANNFGDYLGEAKVDFRGSRFTPCQMEKTLSIKEKVRKNIIFP